jgi:hypothetical protein
MDDDDRTFIAMAGNTFGSAFALLRDMGFHLTHVLGQDGEPNGWMQAENDDCVLQAEDPVLLLGLAQLYAARGAKWRSTGAEVDDFLGFQAEAM